MQGTFPRLMDRAPEGPLPAFAIIFLYKDGAAYQKMRKWRENLRSEFILCQIKAGFEKLKTPLQPVRKIMWKPHIYWSATDTAVWKTPWKMWITPCREKLSAILCQSKSFADFEMTCWESQKWWDFWRNFRENPMVFFRPVSGGAAKIPVKMTNRQK